MACFCHLVHTLTNTNDIMKIYFYQTFVSILIYIHDILKVDLCHLANTLTNTNNILKVASCYLANILINTNDKADNFIKRKLVAFNQLFIFIIR